MREEMIEKKYEEMGISKEVYRFGKKIEDELKERFAAIDATAEYNQMKVIDAMQKNRVSAECFAMSNGYGYNDLGRDTLEKYTQAVSMEKMLWSVRRLPAEPMHWHWH